MCVYGVSQKCYYKLLFILFRKNNLYILFFIIHIPRYLFFSARLCGFCLRVMPDALHKIYNDDDQINL